MTQDKSTPRPWGLSDAAIREWAASLANLYRNMMGPGEPPQERDITLCEASILTMLSVAPKPAVNSHAAMQECVEALKEIAEGRIEGFEVGDAESAWFLQERARSALAKLEKAT